MKNNRMLRLSCVFLAVLMTAGLAACTGAGQAAVDKEAETTLSSAVNTTAPVAEETGPVLDEWGRELVEDSLPEGLKFPDTTVTILNRDQEQYYREFYAENITGDIVNDAVYNRNLAVEDRLGIQLEVMRVPGWGSIIDDYRSRVTNAYFASTQEFDIVGCYAYYGTVPTLLNCYYNLKELPNLDLDKPWWRSGYINAATVHDQLYTVVGDVNLSVIDRSIVCYFNKKLVEQYQLGNLYALALSGGWTVEKMMELTKDTYIDANNNGKIDAGDFAGLTALNGSEAYDGFIAACQMPIVAPDKEGMPKIVFDVEHASSVLDKLLALFYQNNGAVLSPSLQDAANSFYGGNSIFWLSTLAYDAQMTASLRSMNDGYGILPLPKYDESQTEYRTTPQDAYNLMSVMRDTANPEAVGATLELLCAESWRTVRPVYSENAMKMRYLQDSESGQIFDMIVDNLYFDYSIVYGSALSNIGTILVRDQLRSGQNTLASQFKARERILQKQIETFDKTFIERAEEK